MIIIQENHIIICFTIYHIFLFVRQDASLPMSSIFKLFYVKVFGINSQGQNLDSGSSRFVSSSIPSSVANRISQILLLTLAAKQSQNNYVNYFQMGLKKQRYTEILFFSLLTIAELSRILCSSIQFRMLLLTQRETIWIQ